MKIKEASEYGVDSDGYIVYLSKAEMLATVAVTGWLEKSGQAKNLQWWGEFHTLAKQKVEKAAGKTFNEAGLYYNSLHYTPNPFVKIEGMSSTPKIQPGYTPNADYLQQLLVKFTEA